MSSFVLWSDIAEPAADWGGDALDDPGLERVRGVSKREVAAEALAKPFEGVEGAVSSPMLTLPARPRRLT